MAVRRDSEGERRAREYFERNEQLRLEQLRRDARRPGGELLEEAMRLSTVAVELRSAGRRARR